MGKVTLTLIIPGVSTDRLIGEMQHCLNLIQHEQRFSGSLNTDHKHSGKWFTEKVDDEDENQLKMDFIKSMTGGTKKEKDGTSSS